MLVLTTRPDVELVTAAGLLALWGRGYVEPRGTAPLPYHLLSQQILAYTPQEGSIASSRWPEVVARLPVFGDARRSASARFLDHLVDSQMLFDGGHGILSIGPGGEQSYGFRPFIGAHVGVHV